MTSLRAAPAANRDLEIVAVLPMAGHATRLAAAGALAASKEILPLGVDELGGPPRLVCEHLLETLALAGVRRGFVVLRRGKWDIPQALGDGRRWGLDLAYLVLDSSASVPETLDRATPLVRGMGVALGFPDVLAEPQDGLARVAELWRHGGADVALGLYPTDRPEKTDMVETDAAGNLVRLHPKPHQMGHLGFTWLTAVWGPRFTELLHRVVASGLRPAGRELYPSDVLQRAVDEGLRVVTLRFPEGSHLDVGTPEDLERARHRPSPPIRGRVGG